MTTNCRCYMKNYCTPNFIVDIQNHATFVARASINYFYNGHFIADSSGPLNPTFQYKNSIPATAYNVVIRVFNLSAEPIRIVYQRFCQTPENVQVILVDY